MAIDQALLDEAERTGRAFLRLYRWSPPCLSFGRNERALDRYDRAMIDRLGIAVVRRPTGGRAVWHEHEVTYAVAAPLEAFGSLRSAYRAIHERLQQALADLGVPVTLASDGSTVRGHKGSNSCFASSVGGELVARGRKLVGSAQLRQGAAFLQHGSILLDGSQAIVDAASRGGARGPGEPITLREILGRAPGFADVAGAVVRAWGPPESRHAAPPAPPGPSLCIDETRFENPLWIWRR
jgi:lipoate-protein ligase A